MTDHYYLSVLSSFFLIVFRQPEDCSVQFDYKLRWTLFLAFSFYIPLKQFYNLTILLFYQPSTCYWGLSVYFDLQNQSQLNPNPSGLTVLSITHITWLKKTPTRTGFLCSNKPHHSFQALYCPESQGTGTWLLTLPICCFLLSTHICPSGWELAGSGPSINWWLIKEFEIAKEVSKVP